MTTYKIKRKLNSSRILNKILCILKIQTVKFQKKKKRNIIISQKTKLNKTNKQKTYSDQEIR